MKASVYLLALILLCTCLPVAHAEEYGKIRALKERAAYVTKQRGDFVAKVLTTYAILHERNEQGAVVRIKMDGQWLEVASIEIVPVLKEVGDKRQQVTAHELFFTTTNGSVLNLLSELTIH